MGLKKFNYEIPSIGVTIPDAYAQLTRLSLNENGYAYATFSIQKDRKSIQELAPLDMVEISCQIDKNLPIYEQVYNYAKENIFSDWTDDIVE